MTALGLSFAAFACTLGLAPSLALAQALPAAPAASSASDDAQAIVASPRWHELVDRLRDTALSPVDEPVMRSACRRALDKGPAPGLTPVDTCLEAALIVADPRAQYFPAPERARLRNEARGEFVGIGMELGPKRPGGPLPVVSPLADGPAERAGIQAGDLILRVDGTDFAPLTMPQCVDVMRGRAGTLMVLDIERGPARERLTVRATRERIRVRSVRTERTEPPLVALRIAQFGQDTPAEFSARLAELLRGSGTPPDTLLLDLRGNPGGGLGAMLQVAAPFAGLQATVARLASRREAEPLAPQDYGAVSATFPNETTRWLQHARIAVLVDERTANAAEAFALFLREQRGARILGQRTAGVANVDTMMPLGGDAAMRVHTADLRSSRDATWAGAGIAPDVELAPGGRKTPPDYASAEDTTFAAAMKVLQSM